MLLFLLLVTLGLFKEIPNGLEYPEFLQDGTGGDKLKGKEAKVEVGL